VLVDGQHADAVEAVRMVDQQPLALGQRRTMAVFHDTRNASTTRATVSCASTIPSDAHRSARR